MYSVEEKICILFAEKGISAKKFFQLLNLFGDIQNLVKSIEVSADAKAILGEHYIEICKAIKNNSVDNVLSEMLKRNIFAVTTLSDSFPKALKDIDDPPYTLFCKGNEQLLNSSCLAVIGTRKVSSYGRRITKDFTAILCEYFTIVSGLAYGVDSIAHETTLEENGKTIAVLGGGIVNIYPSANQSLADRIVGNGGLLISEYGINAVPMTYHFPHRNRIVSGLSQGVLVCQAPQKSGTNSTVELALEQGKDVFVVPGEIYDFGFSGSNLLIKTMQGACVTTPRDIVSYYQLDVQKKSDCTAFELDFEEQKIVNALSDDLKTFDQLVEITGLSPSELYFLLAKLELKSIIAKLPGNSYRLYGGIK